MAPARRYDHPLRPHAPCLSHLLDVKPDIGPRHAMLADFYPKSTVHDAWPLLRTNSNCVPESSYFHYLLYHPPHPAISSTPEAKLTWTFKEAYRSDCRSLKDPTSSIDSSNGVYSYNLVNFKAQVRHSHPTPVPRSLSCLRPDSSTL